MRTTWNFYSAGQLVFGNKAVEQLGTLLQRRKLNRVLIVTDRVLEGVGLIDPVLAALRNAGVVVDVFNGGEAEPSIAAALAAVDQARAFQPDCLLGLGGGSNMDLAKIAAVIYTHGGAPQDYFGFDNVPGPVVPLVCVPTTAGTGSEVSHAAVVTDTANQIKVSTLSNYLRPALAIVDPELTYSCPAKVTADSGIDALTHAIEALTATDYNKLALAPGEQCAYEGRYPLGEILAEKAIELVGEHLAIAVREPQNAAAREGMALAATLAGLAFSNCGVALVHALEYPIGGVLHCSHGAGNGLLLPYVMRFNLPERIESFARVAKLLGRDIKGRSIEDAAEDAILAVDMLKREIGIPQRLRDIGAQHEQLPEFAKKAFAIKRLMTINPRQPTEADLLDVLKTAY
ncbi:MAG TPA: iron-containing alcohol dehydrogenase [Pirellulaceae bacterium]|nr:iron-containing alcohol dehydrogenase [Pirellulaceae bacterium]